MIKEIEIPKSVTNMIWRLDTDRIGYRNVLSYILTNPDLNIKNEKFNKYQEEYLNVNYAFEIAKIELIKKYIIDMNIKNIDNWNLDYATSTLYYEVNI